MRHLIQTRSVYCDFTVQNKPRKVGHPPTSPSVHIHDTVNIPIRYGEKQAAVVVTVMSMGIRIIDAVAISICESLDFTVRILMSASSRVDIPLHK
jgi:hypothetical protein